MNGDAGPTMWSIVILALACGLGTGALVYGLLRLLLSRNGRRGSGK